MKHFLTIFSWSLLMLLSGVLFSCGNKGPLYVPQPSEQSVQQIMGAK